MRAKQIPEGIRPGHRALFHSGTWHEPKSGGYADTINPAYHEPMRITLFFSRWAFRRTARAGLF
jgi:hypothetical protein